MNKFSWVSALTVTAVVAITGCDAPDNEDVWIDEQAESFEEIPELRNKSVQGRVMQGVRWQGVEWQGVRWQGITWQGVEWQGVSWQGVNWQGVNWQGINWQGINWQGINWQSTELRGLSAEGSVLSAEVTVEVDGEEVDQVISGEDLKGLEIDVYYDEVDTNFTLRIDDVYVDPDNADGDVYFHKVTYLDAESGVWMPICEDDPSNEAIVMEGVWDEDSGDRLDLEGVFSFSCRNGVVAKCVEWGYRPWAEQDGESLQPAHQACTRMARADYCGDGTPHTLNGVAIDIEDQLETSLQTFETWWPYEAEWNEDGAVCVRPLNLRLWLTGESYPSCMFDIGYVKKCGWKPKDETLLVNRFSFFYNWWQLNN